MGENNGRCPYASKETHFLYAEKMRELYTKMDYCHSVDRDNLVAYGECGVSGTNSADWQDTVRAKLELEVYAQRYGDS